MSAESRAKALAIWQAGVDAVKPARLMADFFASKPELIAQLATVPRIIVVGGGKAGAAMAEALETQLAAHLDRVEGIVNVPNESVRPLKKIKLHGARPMGSNHPTEAGVVGSREMLRLVESAGPDDVCFCLISGGGSALMPAPVPEITLQDKQVVTKLLHECGANIGQLNFVRRNLSEIKGGGLARRFRGKALHSLIISDVVGDLLEVIASGPTDEDFTGPEVALEVFDRFQMRDRVPANIIRYLEGRVVPGRKSGNTNFPDTVSNHIIGNNRMALRAAAERAASYGYYVLNLGSFIEGETRVVAGVMAGISASIREDGIPVAAPACILSGGETTVNLTEGAGKGGRNQEFVLALAEQFAFDEMSAVYLSGGTDGEDGPTDAAGAVFDHELYQNSDFWNARKHLAAHDAYPYFERSGGLIRTGLTETNVMDIRVILLDIELPVECTDDD